MDPAGNRLSVTEISGRTASYTYDSLYRLTGETISQDPSGNNGTADYTYDAVGNRLTRTSSVPAVPSASYAYDANDRFAADTHDNNGNTTADIGGTYDYDFENRLISLNGGAVRFLYDGDGNRVAKTVDGVTTQYLVDDRNPTGHAQVLEEVVAGSVERAYTYGLELISQQAPGVGARFYHHDGQGSVRLLTDAAASPTDAYDYEAFGGIVRSTGSTPNRYLFRGEQFDSTLGSYYLRARYYRPGTGRFLTPDSWPGDISTPKTLHKYAYPSNNPVMLADPSGHFGLMEIGLFGVLSELPSVTPGSKAPKGGDELNLVVNVVTWPDGVMSASLFQEQINTANLVFQRFARIRITVGDSEEVDMGSEVGLIGSDQTLDTGLRQGVGGQSTQQSAEMNRLLTINRTPNRITVYYVPALSSGEYGLHTNGTPPTVLIATSIAPFITLAHEIGHSFLGPGESTDDTNLMWGDAGTAKPPFSLTDKQHDKMRENIEHPK